MYGVVKSLGSLMIGFVLILAAVVLIISNQSHANSKHIEAPRVRAAYKNGICEGTEIWFSPKRGTILVLCGIPETKEWGGLIFRVTENNGANWLGEDAYECSVFISRRSYWTRVISRDGYVPLANFPNVERLFADLMGGY